MKKIVVIIFFIMICIFCVPVSAYAADGILTVELKDGDGSLFDDFAVRLWYVDDWDIEIMFHDRNNEANKVMVEQMVDYAEERNLSYEEKITVNGIAQFEDLEYGLYLVKILCDIDDEKNGTHVISPFAITVPCDSIIRPKIEWMSFIIDPEPTPDPNIQDPDPNPQDPNPNPQNPNPNQNPQNPNPNPNPQNPHRNPQNPVLDEYIDDEYYEIDIFFPGVPLSFSLPQTGLRRWPVPFLYLTGTFLLVFGCTMKRKRIVSLFGMTLGVLSLMLATGFWLSNDIEESLATEYSQQRAQILKYHINVTQADVYMEEFSLASSVEPVSFVVMDDRAYVGILSIPKLNLELPVANTLTNEALKETPCRYSGSAVGNDLVIAAHNYKSHFAGINKLKTGDLIIFTDVNGEEITYQVTLLEIVMPTAVEEVVDSEYDITLFTCTYGGNERVVVRGKVL